MRLTFTLFLLAFVSCNTHSLPNNYFEYGFGATQFDLAEKLDTSNGSIGPSPAGKILVGGRITKSPYVWFETGYKYNGSFETKSSDSQLNETISTNTTYKSQSVIFGLKITTRPYEKFAMYTRFGTGFNKISSTSKSLTTNTDNSSTSSSSSSDSKNSNTLYGGGGFSLAVNQRSHLNVEYQMVNYSIEGETLTDHTAFVTYKIFIR